ncbi:cobyrinate a,c-diamide synthase [Gordonia phthalatica]|uniref:Hydrogenobyrinate a,c-diamide synthase n=1 Tax=Gordonia phthalatica TaxID=1136941 RepID=A0A0N9MTX0_9ACTN|nr:cobyrinate a,c-diamide synthase [Gordonia phthalatica]ALG86030.1 cobyrinic acid ac-diamide synthase [Gordonia phthalatica]
MHLPRILVAAPGTGQGKTTVATGLMAALRRAGHEVSGHKVGPDYIDPGYHALACGRPGRNLDPHLVGEDLIVPLLQHGARDAGVAVIEGVMGLFDGRIGTQGFASTAHVATLTRTPVILVVDVARASRSIGAVVHGMATWDPTVGVAGVILNRVGSARHAEEIREAVGLPILGEIPRDPNLATPSRHLGLVTVAERDESAATVAELADVIARHVDLDAIGDIARSAPDLEGDPWHPVTALGDAAVVEPARRPVVAIAAGRAFTFRYAETVELLCAAGCDVIAFDPARDRRLPDGTAGLYLGGGFPEEHAAAISDNVTLRTQIREAVADGLPTVAECAGLLYLCTTLDERPMAGAIDADARMTDRLTLRYPQAIATEDTLLTRAGERITGHEFHRTQVTPETVGTPAWFVDRAPIGFASETLHASYLHTHWAGYPQMAARFAAAVHAR